MEVGVVKKVAPGNEWALFRSSVNFLPQELEEQSYYTPSSPQFACSISNLGGAFVSRSDACDQAPE